MLIWVSILLRNNDLTLHKLAHLELTDTVYKKHDIVDAL